MKKVLFVSILACSLLATPSIKALTTCNATVMSDEVTYSSIELSQLPEAISTAVEKEYAGAKIDKAFKGSNNTYKVEITLDAKKSTLIVDEKGSITKA